MFSVEEAAELDMRFAMKGPGGAASEKKDPNDEDTDRDEEAEKGNDDEVLKEQREWDDYCDYNWAGMGNLIGRG